MVFIKLFLPFCVSNLNYVLAQEGQPINKIIEVFAFTKSLHFPSRVALQVFLVVLERMFSM